MNDFFEWVLDTAPLWVVGLVMLVSFTGTAVLFITSIVLLVNGYWWAPILIWVVAPAFLVYREYVGGKK